MGRSSIAIFLLIAAAPLVVVSAKEPTVEAFEQANTLYEQKQYEQAIEVYQTVLASGVESAALYFNLGNACFKQGDLGQAILNYLRARRLDPSDEDIRHNLQFARQFARVQMEGVELNPIKSFVVLLIDNYHLSTLAWVSESLFISLILLLILRFGLGFTSSPLRVGIALTLILVLFAIGLTTFKYRHDFLTRRAVIIAEEAPVQTGPSAQSDLELQGAPGLVVQILDESSDYYNVLFENKRRGWIRKDLVAEI
ncbi:MAG: tetratricopeptide repeat protein [Candidatus Zixiibacteriota bacterium]